MVITKAFNENKQNLNAYVVFEKKEDAVKALEKNFGMNKEVEMLFEGTYAPEGATEVMMAYFRAFQK